MSFARQIIANDVCTTFFDHPGYIAGRYYAPMNIVGVQTGTASGQNTIKLFPAYIKAQITINELALKITTASAGGNVQCAIYANNAATGRPTGNALIASGSISTTSAVGVSAVVANTQLGPGMYWFATNSDNATSAATSVAGGGAAAAGLIGTTSLSTIIGTGGGLIGLSVTQTFGTWPDLTSGSFTDSSNNAGIPFIYFKVASVP